MKRPGKKDIKAAIDALKKGPETSNGDVAPARSEFGQLSQKKSSQRIRKQGI